MYDRAISTGNIHNLVYIPSTFCVGALRANALQPITTYLRQLGRWADVGLAEVYSWGCVGSLLFGCREVP
jgi:hypothetical protein